MRTGNRCSATTDPPTPTRKLALSLDKPHIVVWCDRQRLEFGARMNPAEIAYPQLMEKQVRFLQQRPKVVSGRGSGVMAIGADAPLCDGHHLLFRVWQDGRVANLMETVRSY